MSDPDHDFTWRDGERTVRFARGAVGAAPALLDRAGFQDFALLTTARAEESAPALASAATIVLHVPHGAVPEAAAAVRGAVGGRSLVALGGGRVIDAAKGIGAADGLAVAAVPTTLSGAPMTTMHRLPAGVTGVRNIRPRLVVFDPAVAASQPDAELAASAMNALAHAAESLYGPWRSPVTDAAALRAARAIHSALAGDEVERDEAALGALLAGYAVGSAGIALHHVLSQTLVRITGLPHAKAYTAMLPHTVAFMAGRAPRAMAPLAAALGEAPSAEAAGPAVAALAARAEIPGLDALGLDPAQLDDVVEGTLARPDLAHTPGPPVTAADLRRLLEAGR